MKKHSFQVFFELTHRILFWPTCQLRNQSRNNITFKSINKMFLQYSEAATQRCFKEKVFWKYAANLQENTHAEVRFQ